MVTEIVETITEMVTGLLGGLGEGIVGFSKTFRCRWRYFNIGFWLSL